MADRSHRSDFTDGAGARGEREGGPGLVTDAARVRELAAGREDAHHRWRAHLKALDIPDGELDRRFQQAYAEVREQIDCTACGACCKVFDLTVEGEDLRRLAALRGQTEEEFRAASLVEGRFDDSWILKTPCPFLQGTRCSCYEDRPEVCRSYPHLDQGGVRGRLLGIIRNAAICPLVFNVVERLRREL